MRWILKRTGRFVLTLWTVLTLAFFLVQAMPGGPSNFLRAQLRRQGVSPEEIEQRIQVFLTFDPDAPPFQQYVEYMTGLLQGDLGQSIWYGESVASLLAEAAPWTVFVMGFGIFFTFLFGIGFGSLMAYKEGSAFDSSLSVLFIFLNSVPYYIAGLLLIFFLATNNFVDLFPTGTRYSPYVSPGMNIPFIWSALRHATLPILSVVITGMGGQALAMRGNSINILGTDFLRGGRIRGLSTWRLSSRYVARNAVLPMYTSMMIAIGFMFGGSIILEQIFSYPGVGWYMVKGVKSRDYFLLMGGFLMITVAVLVGIYTADLTYGKIDPRIRSNDGEGDGGGSGGLLSSLRHFRQMVLALVPGVGPTASADTAETSARVGELPDRFETPSGSGVEDDAYPSRFRRFVVAPALVLWDDWRGRVGGLIILGYLLMGTIGVVVIPPPKFNQGEALIGMFQTVEFPLGTDGFGQGLFRVIVHATPAMLKMVAAGAVFATGVATVVGSVSGYRGGSLMDRLLMFFTDTMMAVPGLPLIIVIAALFEPKSPYLVGLMLSINAWAGLARAIRSEMLSLREESYVEASNVMGISTPTIIVRDLLPNVMPYITINFVNAGRAIIYNSVGLYFLGLLPFSKPNWGVMLNFAYNNGALASLEVAHWLFVPMMAIILLTLGLTLFAQAADRVFNPRTRARHIDRDHDEVADTEPEPSVRPGD